MEQVLKKISALKGAIEVAQIHRIEFEDSPSALGEAVAAQHMSLAIEGITEAWGSLKRAAHDWDGSA